MTLLSLWLHFCTLAHVWVEKKKWANERTLIVVKLLLLVSFVSFVPSLSFNARSTVSQILQFASSFGERKKDAKRHKVRNSSFSWLLFLKIMLGLLILCFACRRTPKESKHSRQNCNKKSRWTKDHLRRCTYIKILKVEARMEDDALVWAPNYICIIASEVLQFLLKCQPQSFLSAGVIPGTYPFVQMLANDLQMREWDIRLLCRQVLISKNNQAHYRNRTKLLERIANIQKLFTTIKKWKYILCDNLRWKLMQCWFNFDFWSRYCRCNNHHFARTMEWLLSWSYFLVVYNT